MSLIENVPNEIVVEIFTHINDKKQLLNLQLLSQEFQYMIRNTRWIHIQFRMKNLRYFDYVVNNYKIGNWNFRNLNISEEKFRLLKHCHIIDLSHNMIKESSIKDLKNWHTLNLSYTNVNDKILKELSNCHTLNLSHCDKITDGGIKELSNCHTLNLSYCKNIIDEGVKHLTNCHILMLHNTKISNETITMLRQHNVIVYKNDRLI